MTFEQKHGQKPIIYLASPLGFSKSQKELILPKIVQALESLGYEVLEPFAKNNQGADIGPGLNYVSGRRIAMRDHTDVRDAHAIFAVTNGEPSDVGTYYEIGIAAERGLKIFIFRDDFRLCSDCKDIRTNLMFLSNLPPSLEEMKQIHYYETIESITDPKKGLSLFSKGEDIFPYGFINNPKQLTEIDKIRKKEIDDANKIVKELHKDY